jgi:hypothetical protein
LGYEVSIAPIQTCVAIQSYFGSMKNLSERSEGFLEAQDIFLEAGDGPELQSSTGDDDRREE